MNFKLPTLPSSLAQVIQIQRAAEPDDKKLISIIEKDPALAIYVLQQVNSAYYGLRKQISDIRRAVTLLGPKRVCNMVLTAVLKQTFSCVKKPAARTVYQHILKTSVATSAFSRDLTAHLGLSSAETAFTAGLLHQLGRLVFLHSAPDAYLHLWYSQTSLAPRGVPVAPSLENECSLFNTDHMQLGSVALGRWGLPDEFVDLTHRLRSLDALLESPIRILPLIVAIGRTAAEDLFEPEGHGVYADYTANGQQILFSYLAQARNLEANALDAFLSERREAVEQLAESIARV